MNYRVNQSISPSASQEQQVILMKKIMFREERESDTEIPLTVFTKECFDIQKKISLVSVAKTWGLEVHWQTPDFGALEKFLDTRYCNSEDDIEHKALFPST